MNHKPSVATRWTYEEYRQLRKDGRRHEIIDGEHYVNPAPETYHQTLSRRIQFQLYQQIEDPGLGEVYDAPTDLQLSTSTIVQPDLIVVLTANRSIITPTKIKGVPDLVVEILSPSTAKHDRVRKHGLYARVGVPEYWLVDPDEHVVQQFVHSRKRYALAGTHADRIDFKGLKGISVDLRKVW